MVRNDMDLTVEYQATCQLCHRIEVKGYNANIRVRTAVLYFRNLGWLHASLGWVCSGCVDEDVDLARRRLAAARTQLLYVRQKLWLWKRREAAGVGGAGDHRLTHQLAVQAQQDRVQQYAEAYDRIVNNTLKGEKDNG
jgi:hypothetical protein